MSTYVVRTIRHTQHEGPSTSFWGPFRSLAKAEAYAADVERLYQGQMEAFVEYVNAVAK